MISGRSARFCRSRRNVNMTPGMFDLRTSQMMLGDALCKRIEDSAREAAANGGGAATVFFPEPSTYWERAHNEFVHVVWRAAHDKRKARLERTKT